jgi:OOP family OmpA-OmpF porin
MYKTRLSYLFLIATYTMSYGQDTINYNRLVIDKIGESVPINYKSSVTGAKMKGYLQDGKWLAVDSLNNVLIEAHYSANKKKQITSKDGLEIFLDPILGDTILIREFDKGKLKQQLAYRPAIIAYGNTIFHCYLDFASYTVAEYTRDYSGKGDFTSIWKSTLEDPKQILKNPEYLRQEAEYGDPTLIQPATYSTKAQYNYVNNPEFEVHPKAQFSIMSFTNQMEYWSIASESPDLYISPESALSGSSFVGFRVFSLKKDIEYLQNELKQPLKKDSIYCFSTYLRLSPGSKYATNAFGFLLSAEPQQINTDQLLRIKPSKQLNTQILNYKTRWMKVQCTYKAQGGEKYLVIGSFQNHKELQLVEVPGQVVESYYYMDDVSLVPIDKEEHCDCNFADERKQPIQELIFEDENNTKFDTLKVGQKIVLDNIHFENDEAELLLESYKALYDVLLYLTDNFKVKVEISGHTSCIGGTNHNLRLSSKRSEAVKKFLSLNGIADDRIETVGFGAQFPIASNETEAGQKENRRVEFKILAK